MSILTVAERLLDNILPKAEQNQGRLIARANQDLQEFGLVSVDKPNEDSPLDHLFEGDYGLPVAIKPKKRS